ncbi:MAG: ShlB/FhaC/HecB family hemolysin secretion/activation protein [Pseudomonadota bacterium]
MLSLQSGFRFFLIGIVSSCLNAATAADQSCIELKRIDIDENRILSPLHKLQIQQPFLGSCIEPALIRKLLATLSDFYINQGYITTRPYLEEQDINDGHIEIQVLPGRIEALVDSESGTRTLEISSAFAFQGDLLNLEDLEAALETMQRLASVSATFEIRPGQQQGYSVVVIKRKQTNPLRISWGVNAQTDLDERLSLQASLDNPFRLNDRLELYLNSGEVRESLQSDKSTSLNYSFAIASSLLSLTVTEVSFDQRLQGIGESFLSTGETQSRRLQISSPLLRSRQYRLEWLFAIELKDTENFFEDQLIDVSSYRTSQAQFAMQQTWFFRQGQFYSSFQLHRGLDSYGARDDEYFSGSGAEESPTLQFEKIVSDSRLTYYLADSGWQHISQLFFQYSEDLLFSNDRVNLGSPFTVRGYASALNGSNAWYWRNDLSHDFADTSRAQDNQHKAKRLTLSVGADFGRVRCQADNRDSCGDIYGLGASVNVSDRNFNARLAWGHPLKKINDDIGDKDQYYLDMMWHF